MLSNGKHAVWQCHDYLLQEAEQMHLKAIAIKERLLAPEDYEVALSVGHLASLYNYDMQKFDDAERLYNRSVTIGRSVPWWSTLPLSGNPAFRAPLHFSVKRFCFFVHVLHWSCNVSIWIILSVWKRDIRGFLSSGSNSLCIQRWLVDYILIYAQRCDIKYNYKHISMLALVAMAVVSASLSLQLSDKSRFGMVEKNTERYTFCYHFVNL